VLWQLARRRVDVTGFETFAPGHDRGAAGGDTRIFRSAHFEDSRWVPVLARADTLWDELSQATGRELRRLIGCVLTGPRDHGQMLTVLQSIAEHGLDHQPMDHHELARRFPVFRGTADDTAIIDTRAGFVRPELTILLTAQLAERSGAKLVRNTRVLDVAERGSAVAVTTDRGVETFDRVVVTAGPWCNQVVGAVTGTEVTVRRPISAWYALKDPATPLPTFIRTGPRHFYAVPSPDGLSMKLGLSVTDHLVLDDPDRVPREVTTAELEPFDEIIDDYIPGVHPDPIRVATYLEGYTPDSRPIVHSSTDGRGITVLAGFSGHGFKLAPAFGQVGADLALTGHTDVPIDFLRREPIDA
jgi:sarcosine oxidase